MHVILLLCSVARCETPQCVVQVADSVTVVDYRDSAQTATGSINDCCSGILVTTGPNMTSCMEEGHWELQLNSTQTEMIIKLKTSPTVQYSVLS